MLEEIRGLTTAAYRLSDLRSYLAVLSLPKVRNISSHLSLSHLCRP